MPVILKAITGTPVKSCKGKKNQRLEVVLNEWYVRGTGLVTEGKQIMTQKVKDGVLFALMQKDPVPFHL